MRDHRKLAVFPKAHDLVLSVYRVVTPHLPRSERFGLVPQMQSCARSIPANLLEGCGRHTNKNFASFVDISTGSANELRYYAILTRDLEMLPSEVADELERRVVEVIRMLVVLARETRWLPDPKPRPRGSTAPKTRLRGQKRGLTPDS